MITPTIGRIVWLYATHRDVACHDDKQPFAAQVVFVHNDRLINVAYFDHNGAHHALHSVTLVQDEEPKPDDRPYAEWMPYQKGQASKHDADQSPKTDLPAPKATEWPRNDESADSPKDWGATWDPLQVSGPVVEAPKDAPPKEDAAPKKGKKDNG